MLVTVVMLVTVMLVTVILLVTALMGNAGYKGISGESGKAGEWYINANDNGDVSDNGHGVRLVTVVMLVMADTKKMMYSEDRCYSNFVAYSCFIYGSGGINAVIKSLKHLSALVCKE